jgi:hypothetical protein
VVGVIEDLAQCTTFVVAMQDELVVAHRDVLVDKGVDLFNVVEVLKSASGGAKRFDGKLHGVYEF